jgi:FixJ family two-component response regulator
MPVEIVFLTAFADTHTMRRAFLNEATDFLEKPVVLERLLEALERAFTRLQTSHPKSGDSQGFHLLTPREREVLDAIAQGLTHREVGERLGISPRTVEVHKGRVMEKLGTKTLADLLRRAMHLSN